MTTNDNSAYQMAGSITSNKRVYMRNKDMAEFEKELETSRTSTEDPETKQESVKTEQPENPISPESTSKDPFEKRYKDLQPQFTKVTTENANLKKLLAEKDSTITELQTKIPAPQMPTSEEEFQDWVKQFPPLYNIMRTAIIKEINSGNEFVDIKNKLKEVEEFRQTLANERGKNELLKLHPDAEDFLNEGSSRNIEFGAWYDEQEPEIKALVDSGVPSKMARAISIFKEEKKIVTKSASDKKKEASKGINVGPTPNDLPNEGKKWTESMVLKMSSREYERNYAEIEKARAEGRFIYDLSRSN